MKMKNQHDTKDRHTAYLTETGFAGVLCCCCCCCIMDLLRFSRSANADEDFGFSFVFGVGPVYLGTGCCAISGCWDKPGVAILFVVENTPKGAADAILVDTGCALLIEMLAPAGVGILGCSCEANKSGVLNGFCVSVCFRCVRRQGWNESCITHCVV